MKRSGSGVRELARKKVLPMPPSRYLLKMYTHLVEKKIKRKEAEIVYMDYWTDLSKQSF